MALALLISMSACASTGGDNGFCSVFKPTYLTDSDISTLSVDVKRKILRDNEFYKKACKTNK